MKIFLCMSSERDRSRTFFPHKHSADCYPSHTILALSPPLPFHPPCKTESSHTTYQSIYLFGYFRLSIPIVSRVHPCVTISRIFDPFVSVSYLSSKTISWRVSRQLIKAHPDFLPFFVFPRTSLLKIDNELMNSSNISLATTSTLFPFPFQSSWADMQNNPPCFSWLTGIFVEKCHNWQ